MADDTSGADHGPRGMRAMQHFGTIVVVGGGCYGSYYVRQLGRAAAAGAVRWRELVVVDRDAGCSVARLSSAERPPAMRLVHEEWRAFFGRYLREAADGGAGVSEDAVIPSPLMPHLMADWLAERAQERWPALVVATEPLAAPPAVPWQQAGADGTHYVSFAEWICPINCIEPPRCPHTRGPRDWSMPVAVREYVTEERAKGRQLHGPFVFFCAHRAYGVGMLDVRDIVAADAAIAALAGIGRTEFLVGTVSHCHGALRRVVVGA